MVTNPRNSYVSVLVIMVMLLPSTTIVSALVVARGSHFTRRHISAKHRPFFLQSTPTVDGTIASSNTGFDSISIDERTTSCLDFAFVLECLRNATVTVLGAEISGKREAQSADEASMGYAMVDELFPHLGFIPLRTSMNVWPIMRAIEMNTSPPEREDLANFAENIESLDEVRTYFETNIDKLGLYLELVEQLLLPDPFTIAFKGSFDDEGKLNAEKYPELGRLRQQAEVLRGRIIQTIQTLLRSQDMKEKLSDK